MRANARYVAVLLSGLTVIGVAKAPAQDFRGRSAPAHSKQR